MWEKEDNQSKKMWVRESAWSAVHRFLTKNAQIVTIPKNDSYVYLNTEKSRKNSCFQDI